MIHHYHHFIVGQIFVCQPLAAPRWETAAETVVDWGELNRQGENGWRGTSGPVLLGKERGTSASKPRLSDQRAAQTAASFAVHFSTFGTQNWKTRGQRTFPAAPPPPPPLSTWRDQNTAMAPPQVDPSAWPDSPTIVYLGDTPWLSHSLPKVYSVQSE